MRADSTGPTTPPCAPSPPCPLCRSESAQGFVTVAGRDYYRCPLCALRFLDPAHHPDRETERACYALHENNPEDPRYRAFLARLAAPLLAELSPDASGLDYGSGPGPALAAMLREAGHRVALYDPLFAPDTGALQTTYDFVTCTETAEHFHDPASEFARLDALLRPGGLLGLMTIFQNDDARFASWHYRRDPTHVVFYREETMHWIANRFGWHCTIPRPDVVLMRKPGISGAGSAEEQT
ncbi:methyltransferase domain-containing protein [Saliniramus sp.]|uniref:methyltransferase domain-containing protein n=1 Tax=Saliniramus sp. TaxID=2986772 RepID=UPI002CF40AD1|nr:methyltransferase domain-containing protein [Saliniramus sp.]HMB11641.1 methyltransferase domain-containing protein [Saliniramus sp.]